MNAREPDFHIGDLALIKNNKVPLGLSVKLTAKFKGPYYIVELGPNHTYRLRHCEDSNPLPSLMYTGQIKLFYERPNVPPLLAHQPQTNAAPPHHVAQDRPQAPQDHHPVQHDTQTLPRRVDTDQDLPESLQHTSADDVRQDAPPPPAGPGPQAPEVCPSQSTAPNDQAWANLLNFMHEYCVLTVCLRSNASMVCNTS